MHPKKYVKTSGFSVFFLRDGLLRWGPDWPRRSKTKKTHLFSLLFIQTSRTLDGFPYFLVPSTTSTTSTGSPGSPGSLGSPGSPGSSSTAAAISKSNENTGRFNTFCGKAVKTQGFSMVWKRGLGVQSHASKKSMSKLKVFQCVFLRDGLLRWGPY